MENILENSSYLYGVMGVLSLTFWHTVYFIIFLLLTNFVIAAKVVTSSASKFNKLAIAMAISFSFLLVFGFIGWIVHLLINAVFYALASEFKNDY